MKALIFTVVATAFTLAGCESSRRVYSADREDDAKDQVSAIDWRVGDRIDASKGEVDAEGNLIGPAVDADEALRLSGAALAKMVKDPTAWKYAYCRVVCFQPGCYGWAVRYDIREKRPEARAGDNMVKVYVLLDKSVVVPTPVYPR